MPIFSNIEITALGLYVIYGGLALSGIVILLRVQARRRWLGILIAAEAICAAVVLTWMSSKLWFDHNELIRVNLQTLLGVLEQVLIPLGLGIVIAGSIAYLVYRFDRGVPLVTAVLLCLLFVPLLAVTSTPVLVAFTNDATQKLYDPKVSEIGITSGFTIGVLTQEGFHYPTGLAFGPDGRLYVSDYNGQIWAIPVKGGIAGTPQVFATGFVEPVGIAWRGNELYVASHGKISVVSDSKRNGVADRYRDILSGFPSRIYPWHSNEDMAFGPDGRLYFSVGATTDSSPETFRYAASILSANPDGSDLRVFATGVRNPFDLDFNSQGDLFATDNGPDTFSNAPPDELNFIVKGGDYGFPKYFGMPPANSTTQAPTAVFPPHASADGIVFYKGSQFPEDFQDNAFITAFHSGEIYRVELSKLHDGGYAANTTVFADGFQSPLGITVGPDGNLYIGDFGRNVIYRISSRAATTYTR